MKVVSGKEMCRILARHGWALIRIRGSHHLYGHGNLRIEVPVHANKDLKHRLQRKIMRDAGLTDADLT
ncbi:MAG TPA: type II toxin-antitoxin system HicA family toxin [Thermomicrobiales bacterium]|nr:type II toxin-antitoxin system HicA family toxin [Thermomicrobiales bacterium]